MAKGNKKAGGATVRGRLCPILEKEGKPVICGNWCAWRIVSKNARYSGCAVERLARSSEGINYLLRSGALSAGPQTEPQAADEDVPF